jgi:hypothetical protein
MGRLFRQCKKLVVNIPTNNIDSVRGFATIDEVANATKDLLEDSVSVKIPPTLEFWGHCSNIQTWFENEYDTSLLHSDLAFPLLRELNELGDPIANKVIKNEISKRLKSGKDSVILFLLENHYLDIFSKEELISIYNNNISKLASSNLFLPFLYTFSFFDIPKISEHCKTVIKDIFFAGDFKLKKRLLDNYIRIWSKKDLLHLFEIIKTLSIDDSNEIDRIEVLDKILSELKSNYDFTLNSSEIIRTLLITDEQEAILDIFNNSEYPYFQGNFEDDTIRRRVWDKKLYYDFFRGSLDSIELLYISASKEEFYRNLEKIKIFKNLRYFNLISFYGSSIDYNYIKSILVDTNIETIRTYVFSGKM